MKQFIFKYLEQQFKHCINLCFCIKRLSEKKNKRVIGRKEEKKKNRKIEEYNIYWTKKEKQNMNRLYANSAEGNKWLGL